jgi:hypothetical protein
MEQVLGLVANLGFPIVVSVYLLVRIENRMESLTESIHRLAEAVGAIHDNVGCPHLAWRKDYTESTHI